MRGKQYEWESGDCLALIALKYHQKPEAYKELVDYNRVVLYSKRFKMSVGDIIQIPDHWFPLPTLEYTIKFTGSFGHAS